MSKNSENSEVGKQTKLTWKCVAVCCLVPFGISFIGGWTGTQTNIPQRNIIQWIRQVECQRGPRASSQKVSNNMSSKPETSNNEHTSNFSSSTSNDVSARELLWCRKIPKNETVKALKENSRLNAIWSMIGCANNIGAFISVFGTNFVLDRLGHRRLLSITGMTTLPGLLLGGFAVLASSYEIYVVGLFITGLGVGLGRASCVAYVTEVSPTKNRGAMGAINACLFQLGKTIAAVLGLPQLLGGPGLWPNIMWIGLASPVALLIGVLFIPESPRWLLREKQNKKGTKETLQWLRGTDDVEEEIKIIEEETEKSQKEGHVSLLGLFRDPFLRRCILVCIAVIASSRWTGYVAVNGYSTEMLYQSGLDETGAYAATIALLVGQIIFSVVGLALIDRMGRRFLLIGSTAVCAVCCGLMVVYAALNSRQICEGCKYGSLATVFVFDVMYSIGPDLIPMILTSEMFSLSARSSATIVAAAMLQLSTLVVVGIFPFMQATLQEWSFLVFGVATTLSVILFCFVLVETKNKSFEDIQKDLKKKYH